MADEPRDDPGEDRDGQTGHSRPDGSGGEGVDPAAEIPEDPTVLDLLKQFQGGADTVGNRHRE